MFFISKCFFGTDGGGELAAGECASTGLGNVPIPAVSEFSGILLACLHPALCPEWRQQDFPTSVTNIWCLGLPGKKSSSSASFLLNALMLGEHISSDTQIECRRERQGLHSAC